LLSCATMPLGNGLSLAFHRLTSNKSTRSTQPWVRALLLRSYQRLIAERNYFILTQQSLLGKGATLVIREFILSPHMYTQTYDMISYHIT